MLHGENKRPDGGFYDIGKHWSQGQEEEKNYTNHLVHLCQRDFWFQSGFLQINYRKVLSVKS